MLIEKIINEISEELISNRVNISNELDIGLFSGNTGIALFLFHLHDFSKKQKHKDSASFYLEKSFEQINAGQRLPTFCNGIAGVAWTVNYLVKHSFIEEENLEVLDDIDDYLYSSMINYAQLNNFDFLHGATGIALYFTFRIDQNSKAIDYLKEYVDALREYSIFDPDTDTVKIISTIQDQNKENKEVYNLGMAHGISSIIAVLAKILESDQTNLNAKYLLEGFSNYIMMNENINKFENGSMFSTTIELNPEQSKTKPFGSRLGWCYGDMGNGFALYHAHKATGKKKYYEKSFEIFMNTVKRKNLDIQRIMDAGMCHGSSGIIDIFKTVHEYFCVEELIEAEDYWAKVTLDFYVKAKGLKGFCKYTTDGPKYSYSFLEGTSGIGLALLFHHTGKKSEWNEFLLSR